MKTPSQTVTYCSAHDNYTLWDKLTATVKGSAERIAANKLAAAIVLTSQGIPFLLSGEEFARSKKGDGNSYRSPIAVNELEWSGTREFADLQAYYRGLIQIRKRVSAFRDPTEKSSQLQYFSQAPEGVVAYTLPGKEKDPWTMMAVLFNSSDKPQEVLLETWSYLRMPERWAVLADGDRAGIVPLGEKEGSRITAAPRSALILAALPEK